MDLEKNKTEYSPLNNLSSGEEVEQFTLPVSNTDRPKRRRKRKEFDSLKTHSVIPNKGSASSCSICACLTVVLFILLIAAISGLSVLVYQLFLQVGEVKKQYTQLQTTVSSHSSVMSDILVKQDSLQQRLDDQQTLIKNITTQLQASKSNWTLLDSKLNKLVEHQDSKKVPSNSTIQEAIQKAVQFGSDVKTLQANVAELKQKELTNEARIEEMDKIIMEKLSHNSPTKAPSRENGSEIQRLQLLINSINDTFSTKLSTANELLNKVFLNCTSLQTQVIQNHTMLVKTLDDAKSSLEQELLSMNVTLIGALNDWSVNPGKAERNTTLQESSKQLSEVVGRIDQLEGFVREVSGKLDDKITTQTESQVVNMTIAGGLEDIITRVINDKLSEFKDMIDKVAYHSSLLEAEVKQLNGKSQLLTTEFSNLMQTLQTTSNPDDQNSTQSSTSAISLNDNSETLSSSTVSPLSVAEHTTEEDTQFLNTRSTADNLKNIFEKIET